MKLGRFSRGVDGNSDWESVRGLLRKAVAF